MMIWYLENNKAPNTRIDASDLAGSTHKVDKRKKMSGTKGEAKGKSKWVSYCPHCPIPNLVHPQQAPHAVVGWSVKQGTCKSGHEWAVV